MKNTELFQTINDPDIKRLLSILRCRPTLEKTVLAKEMRVSFQTVSKLIDRLKECNILCKNNRIEINPEAYYACGISIGGAQCKVTLIDALYCPISEERFEELQNKTDSFRLEFLRLGNGNNIKAGYRYFDTPGNLNELTEKLQKIVEEVIKLHDKSLNTHDVPPILSIGIALTGSIDAERQVILKSHNVTYLQNMKREDLISPGILQKLRERDIPLTIDHNAKALAVCEKYSLYNADNSNKEYQNEKNIASLYLGSGISCGLILDNKLMRGRRNLNGELGHIVVPRYPDLQGAALKDANCTCGNTGCLEHYTINDGFGMTREEFKSSTSEKLKAVLKSLPPEEYEERLKILGYYWGWAVDLCVKFLNVGLIIFSGKMTCIMNEVWNYLRYPTGNLGESLLDCDKIVSKYGALAPTIGAGILSTYLPNESIKWPKFENETV